MEKICKSKQMQLICASLRTVRNDATIPLNKIFFETPMKYIGDRINVRYDPTSLDKAFIFSDDGSILETIYPGSISTPCFKDIAKEIALDCDMTKIKKSIFILFTFPFSP